MGVTNSQWKKIADELQSKLTATETRNRRLDELGQNATDALDEANLRLGEARSRVSRLRDTLQRSKERWAFVSSHGHGNYDWNADPLYLTLEEGRINEEIDAVLASIPLEVTPASAPEREGR